MPTKDWKLDAIREFRTALNAVAAGAGVAPTTKTTRPVGGGVCVCVVGTGQMHTARQFSQGQGTWTGQEHGAPLRLLHSHCFSFISI